MGIRFPTAKWRRGGHRNRRPSLQVQCPVERGPIDAQPYARQRSTKPGLVGVSVSAVPEWRCSPTWGRTAWRITSLAATLVIHAVAWRKLRCALRLTHRALVLHPVPWAELGCAWPL